MNNSHKKGFTLLEVMIVLALFVLVATLGIKQLSFLDDTIAHAEMDKLVAACFYLQQRAIATNSEKVLICDVQKNEYHADDVCEKLPSQITFGYLADVAGPPSSPSHKIMQAVTFPGSSIHFYPTGIISSGTVYLTVPKKKIMYALSNAVSQASYLRVYRYDGKWKLISDTL